MFNAKTLIALSATFAATLAAVHAAATVNTPSSLVQCQPAAITWSGASSQGSVYLSVIQGQTVGSTPLVSFAPQSGSSGSLTWSKVNITAGTEITVVINDATGVVNYSSQAKVLSGDDE